MSEENRWKSFFSETTITVLDIYDIVCFLLSRVFFSVASTWPLAHAHTDTDLHREFLPQSKQERVHINIRIFLEAVGFGMVSGMQESPPFGWRSLFKWRTEHENHNALRARFSPFFAQCWAHFYRIFRTHTFAWRPSNQVSCSRMNHLQSSGTWQTYAASGSTLSSWRRRDVLNHVVAMKPGPERGKRKFWE